MLEIERKFLISHNVIGILPKADKIWDITQVYLFVDDKYELRVRRKNYSYYLTIKCGSGLTREEYEVLIDELDFKRLAKGNPFVKKTRYVFGKWELDVYDHKDLIIAEIELSEEGQAYEFPDWLKPYVLREVTGEKAYKNQSLCTLDFQWPKY